MERTYIMLKPDALQRKLAGKIIAKIEEKGFDITGMKMFNMTEPLLREHYAHVAHLPFFPEMVEYMTSGPVLGMIVEGEDVVQGMRNLMGPTKWLEAPAGSIRGSFAHSSTFNIIHGSDSVENAEIEIKRFFGNV